MVHELFDWSDISSYDLVLFCPAVHPLLMVTGDLYLAQPLPLNSSCKALNRVLSIVNATYSHVTAG